jgi:FkbM family methyltransferase
MKLVENYMNVSSDMLKHEGNIAVKLLKDTFSIEPNIIFDIGACIGLFSLHLAKRYPNSKIFSFEPIPESYDIFCKNITNNDINNIIAINKGLYSEEKSVIFSLPKPETLKPHVLQKDGMPGLGRYTMFNTSTTKLERAKEGFLKDWDNGVKEVEAVLTTINNITNKYNIKYADIIKLDCEGAEVDILRSNNDFFKNSKVIFAEHHPEFDYHDELSKTLNDLNYMCVINNGLNRFWVNKEI